MWNVSKILLRGTDTYIQTIEGSDIEHNILLIELLFIFRMFALVLESSLNSYKYILYFNQFEFFIQSII